MKHFRVFQRIPAPSASSDHLVPWMERIDQLLLSDPVELMSFVSDAVMVMAAQMKDEENAWEEAVDLIVEASSAPERDAVIGLIRGRLDQILAVGSERSEYSSAEIMAGLWRISRTAPWPDD